MMEKKILAFHAPAECVIPFGHTFRCGGMAMEIKNTHPEYENCEDRMERLKDMRRNCMELLRKLRATEDQSA